MRSGWCLQVVLTVVLAVVGGTWSCPDICQCRWENSEQQYLVVCNGQSLTALPHGLPQNVTKLKLSNNIISNLSLLSSWMPRLEELDLSGNRITSLDENAFRNFPNLTKLFLQSNYISRINDKAFHDLNQLLELDLAENDINFLHNEVLRGLKALKKLNISQNSISTLDNGTFHDQTGLSSLDLSYNPMISLTNTTLSQLNSLNALYLSGCGIVDFPGQLISPTLQLLDLSNNSIPYIDNTTFPPLTGLLYLDLASNNISFITPYALSSVHALLYLTLDDNPVYSLGRGSFNGLKSLKSLSICYMSNLQYLQSQVFHDLTKLQTLKLSHNQRLEFIHGNTFQNVKMLRSLDLSYNSISRIHQRTFSDFKEAIDVNFNGNNFICECGIEWLLNLVKNNVSEVDKSVIMLRDKENLNCTFENSTTSIPLLDVSAEDIICNNVSLSSTSHSQVSFKIGSMAVLRCDFSGYPPPTVTWKTPKKQHFHFYNSHPLAVMEYPSYESVLVKNGSFHMHHDWHESTVYQDNIEEMSDRITLLDDGSLYIDYVLRSDAGPYECVVENSVSKHSLKITLKLDYSVLMEVKIMSLFVGFACAMSFFMLNLIYAFVSALARRCINVRRREAILQLVENLDTYKTTQMARLRENYNTQLSRIRDTYHQRLERIRDNYTTQMSRLSKGASHLREGASHKVDTIRGNYKTIRENYHTQLTKLREYSSHQMEQLREMYSNQVLKVRDYGSTQLGRFHHKYKLQQQHVLKLLEMMNMDNCRTVFETECVRAESMILQTDFSVQSDVTIPSPVDSVSVVSDSEYVTASSEDSSPHTSQQDLSTAHGDNDHSLDTGNVSHHYVISLENASTDGSTSMSCDDNLQMDNTRENSQHGDNFLQTGDTSSQVQIQMIDDSDDGMNETDEEYYHENDTYV